MQIQSTHQTTPKSVTSNPSTALSGRASRPLAPPQAQSTQPVSPEPQRRSVMPQADDARSPQYRAPSLVYYRPTTKGTGVAIRIQAPSGTNGEENPPAAFFEMARQKTPFGRGPDGARIAATFDWESKLTVRLDANELFALLAVIEHRLDALGPEGGGLHHRHGDRTTIIQFAGSRERGGYQFQLSRNQGAERGDRLAVTLSEPEACGWRCFIEALVTRWVWSGGLSAESGRSQRPSGK